MLPVYVIDSDLDSGFWIRRGRRIEVVHKTGFECRLLGDIVDD